MSVNDDNAPAPDSTPPETLPPAAPDSSEPPAAPIAPAASVETPPPPPAELPPEVINTRAATAIAPAERAEIYKRHTLILIALIPAISVAVLWFGWRPGINFVLCWLTAMLSGSGFKKLLHTPTEPSGYRFGRALSSVLFIGCLPPNLPWWGAIVCGAMIDFFSRLSAHMPRWARWFRHISPVVPALILLYLIGPVIIPGTLYQPRSPILISLPIPFHPLIDPSIEEMLRAPNADTKLPPFTWDIESAMSETEYNQALSRGYLPHVDAVSRPTPMAILRSQEPGHALPPPAMAPPLATPPAAPTAAEPEFDALDGLLGFKSGTTLEVSSVALLFGIFLLCLNRILAWRFVLGAVVGVLFAGFLSGAGAQAGLTDRCLNGIEQLTTGGLLLSLFLFAHPTALSVSATASYLQGVLLSVLTVLFRRLLFQTQLPVLDATVVAVLLSALLLPTIESFTRRHLFTGPTPSTTPPE